MGKERLPMDDSIAAFVKSVEIADCRILNTPNFVFLCGGRTQESGSILSARDFFNRHITANEAELAGRVKLAETINDWFDHDIFSDLLELEGYLADLSDLIVLFVESAGSIAELGAFAASDALQPKTLAVLNSAHPQGRTFISDGPVRRIKSGDEAMVLYYEWNAQDLADAATLAEFKDMSGDLIQFFIRRKRSWAKERKLNVKSHGHTMLLIADLVELIGITFGAELIECLSAWEFEINRHQLQKYVSLLTHLRLITPKPNSSQTYYLSRAHSGFVHYAFKPETAVRDRDRIKTLIRNALTVRDERRTKIYQRYLSKQFKRDLPNV
jgi:hypothetical protein